MSRSAIHEFIERSENEAELRATLRTIKGPRAVVELAAGLGYHFTEEELVATISMLSFLQDVWRDQSLQEALTGAETDDAIARIAREHGYAFSAEDLAQVSVTAGVELDDDVLETVAGGTGEQTQPPRGVVVQLGRSVQRQTPKTDFGSVLSGGAAKEGSGATSSSAVAPFVPGATVITAALGGLESGRG